MDITVRCEHCGRRLKVTEKAAGRSVRCPGCERVLQVPVAPGPEKGRPLEADGPGRLSKAQKPGLRERLRARKLKKEVAGLRAMLDDRLEELGVKTLENQPPGLDIQEELSALRAAQQELGEREEALEELQQTGADRSVVKDLRGRVRQLRDRQRELMIAVGRKAEAAVGGVSSPPQQFAVLRRLRSMLEEKEERLREFESRFGPVELGFPTRLVMRTVVLVALLGALIGGGYYAYSSGFLLKGVGAYKAWRVAGQADEALGRSRESLSAAQDRVEVFQSTLHRALAAGALVGSRTRPQQLKRILADLRERDELPPSVIDRAAERYHAVVEEHIREASRDLASKREEAMRAVERMTEDAEQLASRMEEAGAVKATFSIQGKAPWGYIAVRRGPDVLLDVPPGAAPGQTVSGYFVKCGRHEITRGGRPIELTAYMQSSWLQELGRKLGDIEEQAQRCNSRMQRAEGEYQSALRRQRDRLNEGIEDYEDLREAQMAYLSGDYEKARRLSGNISQDSPARQEAEVFWEAVAETALQGRQPGGEGYVVGVWGEKIVTNIGRQSGLRPGGTLSVECSEHPIVDPQRPERVLGYDELPVVARTVHPKSAVCNRESGTQLVPRSGDRVRVQKLRP